MEIMCNLYEQYIASIRLELEYIGYNHSDLSDNNCIVTWLAWKRRTVIPGTRNIIKADTFNCPSSLQQGLTELEEAFKTKHDIWPWQSKLIDKVEYLDGLHYDFGVVHFHLGVGLETSGFINRTSELLFAIIHQNTVYEIGIYRHGDWYEFDILNIIDRNWPELLTPFSLTSFEVLNYISTREEVKASRLGGLNKAIKLDSGRIIISPGGGITLGKTPLLASLHAIDIGKSFKRWEETIKKDIKDQITKGTIEEKDYQVILEIKPNELSAILEDTHKWYLLRN